MRFPRWQLGLVSVIAAGVLGRKLFSRPGSKSSRMKGQSAPSAESDRLEPGPGLTLLMPTTINGPERSSSRPDQAAIWFIGVFVVGVAGSSLSTFLASDATRWILFLVVGVAVVVGALSMPQGLLDRRRYGPTPLTRFVAGALLACAALATALVDLLPGSSTVTIIATVILWFTAVLLVWRSSRVTRTLTQVLWATSILLVAAGMILVLAAHAAQSVRLGLPFFLSWLLFTASMPIASALVYRMETSDQPLHPLGTWLLLAEVLQSASFLLLAWGLRGLALDGYAMAALAHGLSVLFKAWTHLLFLRAAWKFDAEEASVMPESDNEVSPISNWAALPLGIGVVLQVLALLLAGYFSVTDLILKGGWQAAFPMVFGSALAVGIVLLLDRFIESGWIAWSFIVFFALTSFFGDDLVPMRTAGVVFALASFGILARNLSGDSGKALVEMTRRWMETATRRDIEDEIGPST